MPAPVRRVMLLVLHPVFALTGVAASVAGPLLPSFARDFHLSDAQSGLLLFSIYAGMASGALVCRGNYARILVAGCAAMTLGSLGFAWIARPLLFPMAFFYGASVGATITAVSLFAGRNFLARRAATLTLLNFTWSLGATVGPLLAARLLVGASWRTVFGVLAAASMLAVLAVAFTIRDSEEIPRATPETTGLRNLRLIALFGVFFFLEVGVEWMAGAWFTTYILRATAATMTLAAAASALFWGGFLASRGLTPLVLLRVTAGKLLQGTLLVGLAAASLLVASHFAVLLIGAIVLLGLALGPVFPLALAAFLDRARHTSDSRFILSVSGFGGAVLPWLVGDVSTHSGSLRVGLFAAPLTLLVMVAMLPLLGITSQVPSPVLVPIEPADTTLRRLVALTKRVHSIGGRAPGANG
jgi:MFS transporter, FHS family, glucose/mannose:H+ symporter